MIIKAPDGREFPVEMHKARMVQNITLIPAEKRLKAIEGAGYNTFQLKTKDIFLDMLTDSGTNAMSDNQFAGFMTADDAYAGSMTFYDFADAVKEVLGYKYVMNVHQGRAAEHLLAKTFVQSGRVVPTNYHFTTTKVHIELPGAVILEIFRDEALKTKSTHPFKGNMDPQKLRDVIKKYGVDTLRTYLLFIAAPTKTVEWSDKEMIGVSKFLGRVRDMIDTMKNAKGDKYIKSVTQRKVKAVTKSMKNLEHNVAIVELMDFVNKLTKHPSLEAYKMLLKLLTPFAPHTTEELWEMLGEKKMISIQKTSMILF